MAGLDEAQAQALISLGFDKGKAADTLKTLKDIQSGFQGAQKQAQQAQEALRKVAEQGAKMREVGATMAVTGGAILAPFIAAAAQYTSRYGALEKTSRDFLKAQQASTDATSRLGRVAASQLAPILEQVASVQAKIASFAETHPDIARAAIIGGAGLVAGGGALVMAGTAISSISKAMQLLQAGGTGGLMSGLTKFAVTVAALAVGAEIAVKGLNAIGQATGDQRLATYQLSDALKTGRQLVAIALLGVSVGLLSMKKGVEDAADWVSTGFRDLFSRISEAFANFKNSLLDAAASLLKAAGLTQQADAALASKDYTVGGKFGNATLENMYATYRTQNQADYASRASGRGKQYQSDVAGATGSLASFADTGTIGGTIGNILTNIFKSITGAGGVGGAGGPGAGGKGGSPELTQAYIQRNQALLQSERQYGIDRLALQKDYQQNELKAKQDQNAQLAQLDIDQQRQLAQLKENFDADQAKAQEEFNFNETQIQEKAAFDRQQKEREFLRNQTDLAASRDVAGFVEAEKNHQFETKQQMAQDAFDKQQRKEQFDLQSKERLDQYNKERADQIKQNEQKRQDLLTQFKREDSERATAYRNQLDALKTKHGNELIEIDRAFAEQVAALNFNNNYLQGLQNDYYDQMNTAAYNFVQTQKAYLTSLYNGFTGGSTGGTYTPSNSDPTQTPPVTHGSFKTGLDYVPQDMIVKVHKGEGILTEGENRTYRQGGSPIIVNVDARGSIGIDNLKEQTTIAALKGVREAQEQALAMATGGA